MSSLAANRNKIPHLSIAFALLLAGATTLVLHTEPQLASISRTPSLLGRPNNLPRIMLWAWERPEDLRFIDPQTTGVAFLARTVILRGDTVIARPRLQPLSVPSHTALVAVVRLETDRARPPSFSASQRLETARAIASAIKSSGISALQVDFDATNSERAFYRLLLDYLRQDLPPSTSLSITALASWCLGGNWLAELPVDDAVPMLFRMGPDRSNVFLYLEQGGDFRAPVCRQSAGITTDEPLPPLPATRRRYIFNPRAWTPGALRQVLNKAKP